MIDNIYNNQIQPLGVSYTYHLFWVDNNYSIQLSIIESLNEVDCKNFMLNIQNQNNFKCWAMDDFCMSNLPYPINNII